MRAMVFDGTELRLNEMQVPEPIPAAGELLIDIHACGVCRTDLHRIGHELPHPKRPVIPGHEIVGTVAALGADVTGFAIGDRVGVPWLALRLGASWAGSSDEAPPVELDAALLFAPVGVLVPVALQAVAKGGVVVCGGIHMSDIPSFPYAFLWSERRVVSVANLTREDGAAFMRATGQTRLEIQTTTYALGDANRALSDLREGKLTGAAVLSIR